MTSKEQAILIINKFYYSLPNNGYSDYGINSCESRYKEAIMCAYFSVVNLLDSVVDQPVTEEYITYWNNVKMEINIKSYQHSVKIPEID
jgi:hypothetical protein